MDLIAVVFCGHETMLSAAEKDIYQLFRTSCYLHMNFETKHKNTSSGSSLANPEQTTH